MQGIKIDCEGAHYMCYVTITYTEDSLVQGLRPTEASIFTHVLQHKAQWRPDSEIYGCEQR